MSNLAISTGARQPDPDLSGWVPTLSLRDALAGESTPAVDNIHRLIAPEPESSPETEAAKRACRTARRSMRRGDAYSRQADKLRDRLAIAPNRLALALDLEPQIDHYDKLAAEYRALASEAIEHVRESLEFIEARARADANRLDEFLAAARQNRVIRSRATHAPQRSTREPRRRASRSAAAATRAGPGDGDGPPPPEDPPRRRASQQGPSSPVGALLVSDRTALAVSGLNPRQFRAYVRKHGIPHAKIARRMLVRADVLLAALGLNGATPTAKPEPVRSDWRGRALRLIGGGR